jgi:hypothetical protein
MMKLILGDVKTSENVIRWNTYNYSSTRQFLETIERLQTVISRWPDVFATSFNLLALPFIEETVLGTEAFAVL